jgi:Tol biopolymer transport system component
MHCTLALFFTTALSQSMACSCHTIAWHGQAMVCLHFDFGRTYVKRAFPLHHRIFLLSGLLLLASVACTLVLGQPTTTPIPPTFTPDVSATALANKSSTQTALATVPTTSPSPTITSAPPSLTPSPSPLPTSTPLAPPRLAYDYYRSLEIDSTIANGLDRTWVSFRNINDRTEAVDVRTPQSETGLQTIYLARPDSGQRVRVLDVPVSVEDDIFWSPTGRHLLYFLREGPGVSHAETGLYLVDLQLGISLRFYALTSLQPRGIAGHYPQWAPDGQRVLLVMANEYATDVYVINVDGTNLTNLTNTPSYDFWATWSPDGRQIAFISDRDTCSTWQPNLPGTCDHPNATPPTQGKLYVMNVQTGQVQKISDTLVSGPPDWINNQFVSVMSSNGDLLNPATQLWVFDIEAGSSWMVTPADGALYTAAEWQPGGANVVFQRASEDTVLLLTDNLGRIKGRLDRYSFVRYGVTLAWSPGGEYLAIGGTNGQCPYPIIVVRSDFQLLTAPSGQVLACDPVYAPDGRYIAFTGIRTSPGTDGVAGIYAANSNGLGAVNLASRLQGQVHLLGWVGPTP